MPEAQRALAGLQQPIAEEMRQVAQHFKADELALVRDFMRQAKEVFQRQVRDGLWGEPESSDVGSGGGTPRLIAAPHDAGGGRRGK